MQRSWQLLGLLSALAAVDAAFCDADYKANECPKYCNKVSEGGLDTAGYKGQSGFLKGKCCSRVGEKATVLTAPGGHGYAITKRTEWYEKCTGAKVTAEIYQAQCTQKGGYCGGFRALFEIGEGAFKDASGAGIYDGYMVQALDVGIMNDYVEDLGPRIKDTPELEWSDIFPQVRQMNTVNQKVKALPFDFDFLNILLRQDLIKPYVTAKHAADPKFLLDFQWHPSTWEAYTDFVEFWHGKDLNMDGTADFGLCALNGAGPAGPQALLMNIVAAKLQYQGSQQGFILDPEDPSGKWLFDNEAMRQALKLTRRLWMHSADDQPGGFSYLHETLWLTGRCAGYVWLSGSVSKVSMMHPVERLGENIIEANGDVTASTRWYAGYPGADYAEPRRVFPMGSTTVLDRKTNTMKTCTTNPSPGVNEVSCPFMNTERDRLEGDVWVNRVPYYYSAYQHSSMTINKNAPEAKRAMLWEFYVFANLEGLEVVAQQEGETYLDPYRLSQLSPTAKVTWMKKMSSQNFDDMKEVSRWAGSTPNIGLPIAIKGREDFEYAVEKVMWQYFLDVAPCASHIECKCKRYIGGRAAEENCPYAWGTNIDTALYAKARSEKKGSITTDEAIKMLIDTHNVIANTEYGTSDTARLKMVNDYRASIGYQFDLKLVTKETIEMKPVHYASIPIALIFVAIGVFVVAKKQQMAMQAMMKLMKETMIFAASLVMETLDVISDVIALYNVYNTPDLQTYFVWYLIIALVGTALFVCNVGLSTVYVIRLVRGSVNTQFDELKDLVLSNDRQDKSSPQIKPTASSDEKVKRIHSIALDQSTGKQLQESELRMKFVHSANTMRILQAKIYRTFGVCALLIFEDVPMTLLNLAILSSDRDNGDAKLPLLLSMVLGSMMIAVKGGSIYNLVALNSQLRKTRKEAVNLLDNLNLLD